MLSRGRQWRPTAPLRPQPTRSAGRDHAAQGKQGQSAGGTRRLLTPPLTRPCPPGSRSPRRATGAPGAPPPDLPARAPPSAPSEPPSPSAARSALPKLADRLPVALRARVRMGADQPSAAARRLAALCRSPGPGSWLRSTTSNSSPGSGSGPGPRSAEPQAALLAAILAGHVAPAGATPASGRWLSRRRRPTVPRACLRLRPRSPLAARRSPLSFPGFRFRQVAGGPVPARAAQGACCGRRPWASSPDRGARWPGAQPP